VTPISIIDYWAVDWNYDGKTFKSTWHAMRRMGRNILQIPRSTSRELGTGKYTIAIRVVDIFGNDASGIVNVDLRNKN
jgi:adenine-specific DNA-methyltransferase